MPTLRGPARPRGGAPWTPFHHLDASHPRHRPRRRRPFRGVARRARTRAGPQLLAHAGCHGHGGDHGPQRADDGADGDAHRGADVDPGGHADGRPLAGALARGDHGARRPDGHPLPDAHGDLDPGSTATPGATATPGSHSHGSAHSPAKGNTSRGTGSVKKGCGSASSSGRDCKKSSKPAHADPTPTTPAAPTPATTNADGSPAPTNPTFSLAIPGPAPIGVPNFFIDKFRIPPFLLPIYQAAGIQYGVRWEVLAAINEIETDYGRNLNVSSAGALGLDAVHALHLEDVRRRRQRRRREGPLQPGRRDLRRRALPEGRRRRQRPAARDLRLQPRRLVRRLGAAARPGDRRPAGRPRRLAHRPHAGPLPGRRQGDLRRARSRRKRPRRRQRQRRRWSSSPARRSARSTSSPRTARR